MCEIRHGTLCPIASVRSNLVQPCQLQDLSGGTPEDNARITVDIWLVRERGPRRDVVVLNSALGLYLGIDNCSAEDCLVMVGTD